MSSSVVFERSVRRDDHCGRGQSSRVTLLPMAERAAVVEENVLEGRDADSGMVHHAAQVICACMVGANGLTPFRRPNRRKFGTPLAGFGERVWLREIPFWKE